MPIMKVWTCADCGEQVQMWEGETRAVCECGTVYEGEAAPASEESAE